MEANNLRPQGQQELGYSTAVHTAFGFVILLLLALLQVKYQNSGNPFQTHVAKMLLFIVAVIFYAIALVAISQPSPNISYLPILKHVCFIFGAFACDLLLLILVPSFGWFILVLCICISLRLLCISRQQILQCFQQIFRSINQSTSQAFNKSCGQFQNSFQSLFQAGSGAFNRSPMPTTNSTDQEGEEMVEIVVESPMSTANSTEQQAGENGSNSDRVTESDTLQG